MIFFYYLSLLCMMHLYKNRLKISVNRRWGNNTIVKRKGTKRQRQAMASKTLHKKLKIVTVVSNDFHSVKKNYFRPPDHVISMECLALDFRCQCTQQNLQSICAVLLRLWYADVITTIQLSKEKEQKDKDKRWLAKHYTKNWRLCNTIPTKNMGEQHDPH
jgi:hypothetical protein